MQQMLSIADEMQLRVVQPEDQEYPLRFQSICQRCGVLVCETVYDANQEADPLSEERLEADGERDASLAMAHTCQRSS